MLSVETLITDHIDTWTGTIKAKSSAGRGGGKKKELYGIKKLRELILELAVRGLLVPQDPSDENASELLKKIAKEKANLLNTGQIRKQKKLPSIKNDDQHFQLARGWAWTQLGAIAEISPRNTLDDNLEVAFIPMPLITSSYDGCHQQESKKWADIKKGYTHFSDGDIAIAKITPCFENGKAAIFTNLKNGYGAGTTELHVARLIGNLTDRRFILLYLKAPFFLERGKPKMTGSAGQKRIPNDYFIGNPLPLPPLAEQHRIVAKVDELMALCDELEQTQTDHLQAHETLVATVLAALTNASEPKQFEDAWQRIAAHFDTLFTTEASIEALKQTILQLAVMGKLVEQDPEDEPADKLLKEIAAKKARLTEVGEIKKQKALPEISEEEYPFELPVGWGWRRFEDLVNIQSGITKGRKLAGRKTITVPYLSVANVQRSYLNLENIKETQIPVEERQKYQISDRDLLITEGGDWDKVGRTAIWRDEVPYMTHQNHVFKARVFFHDQCVVWLEKYLNSRFSRDYFAGSSKQTTNLASINKTQLRGCIIAVPPHDEQSRIVAKVDELMALCDQLKANLKTAQTTQLNLAESLVEKAIR
jgi:type I restriction enzyme S subunit